MPDGQKIKYSLPAIYVEKYTRDYIFQKNLFFLLPYYIMRYEKQKKIIEAVKNDKVPKDLDKMI